MKSVPAGFGAGVRGVLSGLLVAGVTGVAVLATAPVAAASGPFDGLEGKWSGTGVVTYSDGTKERLQCSVKYEQADPNSITQAVSCASDSYNFRINAYYKAQASGVVGHWAETVLQVSGSLTGTVIDGHISGNLHGPGFQAKVNVDTKGNQQTVTVVTADQKISQVAIAVRRGG
jgi:hypothetical protein